MLNVLIVEDDHEKRDDVVKLFKDQFAEAAIALRTAESVTDAIRCLHAEAADLMIVDLFLPIKRGGAVAQEGGSWLLEEVARRNVKPPSYVIGLTAQPPEVVATSDIYNTYSSFLVLQYARGGADWRRRLSDQINHILAVPKAPNVVSEVDYAIITALPDPEFRQVLNLFPELAPIRVKGDATSYYKGTVKVGERGARVVAAHAPKMGMCASVYLTGKMIHYFQPRVVIMTGISAGVRGNVRARDVIAANYVFSYESGKRRREEGKVIFLPSPEPVSLPGHVTERLVSFAARTDWMHRAISAWPGQQPLDMPRLVVGAIGSGSAVIQDGELTRNLVSRADRKLAGIDMEAYGVAYACAYSPAPGVTPIILKSVSDFADEEKNDSDQALCSYLSASVARYIVEEEVFLG